MMDQNQQLSIALSFSGGGYRAASFSLGVLTYLERIKCNGASLLEHVKVLSTVSGGTITGARYALGIAQKEQLTRIYHALYTFMSDTDLVGLALDRLISDEGWDDSRVKSLINAVADVYDAYLFKNEKFGLLLDEANDIHLKHISFNATEFANAVQFRFQRSEKISKPEAGEPERGIIGNFYYNVPFSVAKDIRLADILASSSCFPGGFEPINFPTDFILPKTVEVKSLISEAKYPVGLMDGGIVDNQGINPLLLAETRIKRNMVDEGRDEEGHALDLIIVSDVTSPYMEDYKASTQRNKKGFLNLTPVLIFTINTILLLASGAGAYFTLKAGNILFFTLLIMIFTVSALFFMVTQLIRSLPKKFHVPHAFLKPFGKLLRLRLFVYENLIMNRTNSLLKMTNDVFLKHIRRLNYQSIFSEPSWKNRRIMNAIYELREGETRWEQKVKDGALLPELVPSEAIQKAATRASSMGTTLWYTKEELSTGNPTKTTMLDTVIACGQFTMCWNLLEYLGKIKKDKSNTNERHRVLMACEEKMLQDWERFKEDPFWLVNLYKAETKIRTV